MTHARAMQILDAIRDGASYSDYVINMALRMTGDLDDAS